MVGGSFRSSCFVVGIARNRRRKGSPAESQSSAASQSDVQGDDCGRPVVSEKCCSSGPGRCFRLPHLLVTRLTPTLEARQ